MFEFDADTSLLWNALKFERTTVHSTWVGLLTVIVSELVRLLPW